jgi:uncharacterized protein (UPF0248 family)
MVSREAVVTMRQVPIHELLNRIRWDTKFARGNFEVGYFDRVERQIVVVPFREISFLRNDPQTLRLVDAEGRIRRVPFHRVREVYKNSRRIWHRPAEVKQTPKPKLCAAATPSSP